MIPNVDPFEDAASTFSKKVRLQHRVCFCSGGDHFRRGVPCSILSAPSAKLSWSLHARGVCSSRLFLTVTTALIEFYVQALFTHGCPHRCTCHMPSCAPIYLDLHKEPTKVSKISPLGIPKWWISYWEIKPPSANPCICSCNPCVERDKN